MRRMDMLPDNGCRMCEPHKHKPDAPYKHVVGCPECGHLGDCRETRVIKDGAWVVVRRCTLCRMGVGGAECR